MKKMIFTLLAAITIIAAFITCNKKEVKQVASINSADYLAANGAVLPTFNEGIGGPILRSTANKWSEKYQQLNPAASSLQMALPADYIKQLFIENKEAVCLAFYFIETTTGLDVVPIAVSADGHLVKTEKLISVSGLSYEWNALKQLRTAYTGAVKARVFGLNTFKRLIQERKAKMILVQLGIDDKNEMAVVLSNAATPESEFEEDQSITCPPICPLEN